MNKFIMMKLFIINIMDREAEIIKKINLLKEEGAEKIKIMSCINEHICFWSISLPVLKYLLETTNEIDINDIFARSCQYCNIEILEYLLNNYNIRIDNDAMLYAINRETTLAIDLLIACGYDIYKNKKFIFKTICYYYPKKERVRYFLDMGLTLEESYLKYCLELPTIIEIFIEEAFNPTTILKAEWQDMSKDYDYNSLIKIFTMLTNAGGSLDESFKAFFKKN